MPETPDFDKIAHRVAMSLPGAIGAPYVVLREHIAQELRLMWNARGAADIAKMDAVLYTDGTSWPGLAPLLDRALRSLNR